MPYSRYSKGYSGSKATRGKRYRKSRNFNRQRRLFVRSSLRLKRNVLRTAVVQNGNGQDLFGSFYFQLADVPNYTELVAMFDAYMITGIKIRFIPQYNMQQLAVPSATTVVPKLFVVVDRNDATAATTINELREYPGVRVYRGFSQAKLYFKPNVATAVYGGGFFTSYGMNKPQWISTQSSTVQHYGVKFAVDAGGSASPQQTVLQKWDVECTYYMRFKNPK